MGVAGAETITDWVPAVCWSEQITITVYVPGPTSDQAADWLTPVPDRATWRPWAKLDWLLLSSDAVPQLPLICVQALVTTDTVEPVVLTEMPEPRAAAGPAAVSASGNAAAAATVRPVRRRRAELRMGCPPAARLAVHPLRRRGRERPCCLKRSQCAARPIRTRSAPGQVTRSTGRPRPAAHRPVVTARCGVHPPQVPSGSRARSRTRWLSPAFRPM
ncbi:hypothetical protein GCM10020256_70680 [Streptomyces thermocoprophilus]